MQKSPSWLIKAKETYKYHRFKMTSMEKWTLSSTAKSLRRSIGSICEDLMIAKACKEYEAELERLEYAYEALMFIREKQRQKDLEDIK